MNDPCDASPVLVEFQRGGPDRVETLHRGAVAVVDPEGRLLHHVGDTARAWALRSTAKPFQLLPLMLDGLHAGDEPLAGADLAIMMSSHNGEPMHTERVAALLRRFDLDEGALRCGPQAPALAADRDALARAGRAPSAIHCNCSGKHTNMLAVCRHRGWPLDTYLDLDHPLQARIRALIASLVGDVHMAFPHSVDGCSLPTFWMPLATLARLFAFIADPRAAPAAEGTDLAPALETLRAAGTAHPELIAGTGSLDTGLMQALGTRLFAKTGAAGLYAAALPGGPRVPTPLGIAIKVEDGDPGSRIRAAVMVEVLRQLGVATPADGALWRRLEAVAGNVERNFGGREVGEYRPVFELAAA